MLPRAATSLLLAVAFACGGDDVASSGGGAGGSDTGDATAASTTTGSTTTGAADTSSSTTFASTSESSGSTDGADVPYPEECEEPEASIEVAAATTPEGPLSIDEAWFGVDACGNTPYVVLAQIPSRENGPGRTVEILLDLQISEDSYLGPYSAFIRGIGDAPGTVDFLEPLEGLEYGVPNPANHLHAQIDFHDGGWDLSVEVDLLDCGVTECFCPCR